MRVRIQGVVQLPQAKSLGKMAPLCLLVASCGSLQSALAGPLRASLHQAFAHPLSRAH